MFNQKGQAFSVFELMIAAIVAVAILFVLLPILGGIGGGGGTNASSAIANALASVEKGGTITSQEFTLQKGDTINSKQFENFDQHSVNFDVNPGFEGSGFEPVGDSSSYSGFIYNGSTKLKVQAKVICETTGTSLAETLDDASIEGVFGVDVTELCEPDEPGQFQPCCLVLIERKKA